MKKYIHNDKGLTLIEVLATLVILGIVFVGIMNIFPQMTLFNAKTYTKLDTMNLALKEVSYIKSLDYSVSEESETLIERFSNELTEYSLKGTRTENGKEFYLLNKSFGKYTYELSLFLKPDFEGNGNTPSLYKIHLKIITAKGVLSSETYGYVGI